MRIILQKSVDNLGSPGDIAEVADGYARNYLIPRRKAIEAVGNAQGVFKDRERARVALEQKQRQSAQTLRDRMVQASLQFSVQVGDEDQLYGSVSAAEIHDALVAQGFEVERRAVRLEEPIKSLGVFEVPVHLFQDIEAPVKVWVVRK
jgi:large subunit ribosomal protein L9